MTNTTWKSVERAIARKVGGERMSNHALGLQTPDVETEIWSIEVKHRKTLPKWLHDSISQAETNASEGKLPLVVLHEKNQRHDNDLVLVRLRDFVDWFGDVDMEEE